MVATVIFLAILLVVLGYQIRKFVELTKLGLKFRRVNRFMAELEPNRIYASDVFAQMVKKRYPVYSDPTDEMLVHLFIRRYPKYRHRLAL